MVFEYKKGARIKCDAQTAGEFCQMLERNGGLTARRLVEESRPKDAPLHKDFEWNNKKAAQLYRESQGRHIISHIVVKTEEVKSAKALNVKVLQTEFEPKNAERACGGYDTVRAFFPCGDPLKYESVGVVISDDKKRTNLLSMSIRDFKAYQAKYSMLLELSKVFDAFEELNIESNY